MTVFLHGFWGQPGDWRQVFEKLPLTEIAVAYDLYEAGPLDPSHPLEQWTRNFHNRLDKECGAEPVQLVGYSMGARLALAAAVAKPERFSRVLLCSGMPVIPKEDHAARLEWEKQWAEKFQTQPWPELASAWQEQAVLANSPKTARRQSDVLREMLGVSLVNWSPRLHPFEWAQVAALKPSVEWAYGALDQKYMEMAKTLPERGVRGQITISPNAGHRLTTDASDFIARWVRGRKNE
jgi:2-succinyl-6-hydroxy-2,4-cyclohexadiene-1-carboxylate synthase